MKKTLLLLMLAIMVPFAVFAQSSGKIAGVVTDKSSGEPLPGVNVVIDGTSYGAATDEDGYFVILNVPVGVYNVTASFIGYASTTIQGLNVSASITTEANFSLSPTQLEMQAIVVTAEKPLVEKNVTQSISLVTSQEIQTIPVRGIQGIAATQNSVVLQDGDVHIRGGRADEVGYYLDGASISSSLSGVQTIHVIQEALQEFQVLAGGYTAEFGDANSGIIRSEMKTGGDKFNVTMDFQTDKFAKAGEKFLGTYSYRRHTFVTTISGPLLSKKLRYFLAWENNDYGDTEIRRSKGFKIEGLQDNNPYVPAAERRTVDYEYPDGYTPDSRYKRNALNGTIMYDLSKMKFRLGFAYQNTRDQISGTPAFNVFNDRDLWNEGQAGLLTFKFTHILSPKTLYELRLSYSNREFERKDDYFGAEWWKWGDSAAVAQYTDGAVIYPDAAFSFDYQMKLAGMDGFANNGDLTSSFYTRFRETYLGGGMDFTTQYGKHHELKAGFDLKSYTVRNFVLNARRALPQIQKFGSAGEVPIDTWVNYLGNVYGYDPYGSEMTKDKDLDYGNNIVIEKPKKPVVAGMYIQDKIEYNDLIINAGLRLDYFDSDDKTLIDEENLTVDAQTQFIPQDKWKELDAFTYLSPRIGFSFPVSEKTNFYSQFGKFVQKPPLGDAYRGTTDFRNQIGIHGFFYSDPVGYGLSPIRTTQYEVGFKQQLGSMASMEISGFYKNVAGQLTAVRVNPDPSTGLQPFNKLTNGDFTTTKGFEFKIRTRRTNRIYTQLNYTYTNAEGTGSSPNAFVSAVENESVVPLQVNPLDFSQKHRGSIVLDYRFGKKEGGPVFSGLGTNLLFTFNSGHPYTALRLTGWGQVNEFNAGIRYMDDSRYRIATEPVNSSTTPWNYNIDLRIDKQFSIMDKVDATVYLRVINLLNSKNVINVFPLTGSAENDGLIGSDKGNDFYSQWGDQWLEMYKKMNLENGTAYKAYTGNELYSSPRQIYFGIKFSY